MNLDWGAIGATGEILGAAVTAATLVYLALQIRHNREATQAASELEATSALSRMTDRVSGDRDLQRIWNLVANDDADLTEEEAEYFVRFIASTMHMCEGVWDPYQRSLLSDRT